MKGDNEDAISNAMGESSSKRSRHVDIDYHYTRGKLEMNTIQLLHIASKKQPTNVLSKRLDVVLTRTFRGHILGMGCNYFGQGAGRTISIT